MAHTIKDKIIELADKFTINGDNASYHHNKAILIQFTHELGLDLGDSTYSVKVEKVKENPVNEDLEEAAMMHFKDVMEYEVKTGLKMANITSFRLGAKWQKEQMMAKAVVWFSKMSLEDMDRYFSCSENLDTFIEDFCKHLK